MNVKVGDVFLEIGGSAKASSDGIVKVIRVEEDGLSFDAKGDLYRWAYKTKELIAPSGKLPFSVLTPLTNLNKLLWGIQ